MNNQFSLLKTRRFLPLFLTQFFGAFNDNVFKNAVIILISFSSINLHYSTNTLINMAGALFILPFFLFSATFGQLTDRYNKARILQIAKGLEIIVMLLAGVALLLDNLFLLLLGLFLLGTQATLFGPAKYSILPQHLKTHELIGGNGLIETATFIAILTGTIFGGILITIPHTGKLLVASVILCFSIIGLFTSLQIPSAPSRVPHLSINWNIFTSTWQNLKFARRNRVVFLAVLGISWFWFYGAFIFYQAPNYAKHYLGGNAHVATMLIATYAIGIGFGALIVEKIARRVIEIGLVPLATIFISILTALLYFCQPSASLLTHQNVMLFFSQPRHLVLIVVIFLIGMNSAFFTVPLYAMIQERTHRGRRSRVIAANNILNALFMTLAACFAIFMLKLGLTIPELFIVIAILNALVMLYIFAHTWEFAIRLGVYLIVFIMYRLRIKGFENLSIDGPAIYACNHVSFVDVIIMTSVSKRPIRFLMDYRLFHSKIFNKISDASGAIPIASAKENPHVKEEAMRRAAEALKRGDILGLFPEGSITRDGKMAPFKKGIVDIITATPVPVIPMAIYGLWGSYFSRIRGRAMKGLPRRFRSKIYLNIGKPIMPDEFSLEKLEKTIEALYHEAENILF